ncbi:hypothetical protein [Cupriavidus sp. IDO]|uniref:hypothetical protein n=1 Tax=Cupriavidus sp. IDO TaxID=1539142 RepID=UPI001EE71525|nr:hypothetical protein [Cupriavidus sp. IDO]
MVTKIDEGHRLALASQLEVEDAAIECQRFLDIADFQRYVVEADGARLYEVSHLALLLQSLDSVHKLDHDIVRPQGGSTNQPVLPTGTASAMGWHLAAALEAQGWISGSPILLPIPAQRRLARPCGTAGRD